MKKVFKQCTSTIVLIAIAVLLGAIVGAIDALFGRVLLAITDFRDNNPYYLIPFLTVGGVAVVFAYNKLGKGSEKGMSLVLDTANGKENNIPLQLVPLITIGTWVTHLFGGSAGREGVAVQIGATIFHNAGKKIKIENADKILIIAGMAAGFSGLFQTPFAALFFALEVSVAGKMKYKALLPSLLASLTACKVSSLCGLEKFSVAINVDTAVDFVMIIRLCCVGVLFGLVGGCFAWLLKKAKAFAGAKIKNNINRIAIISLPLSAVILLLFSGRYAGLGTNLISYAFSDDKVYAFDFVIKLILTVITLSAGFQGGEVTPLFSIGASLGAVVGGIVGIPTELCAAIGYAAVFGSATNTFFAPILIGAEVFGYDTLPFMIIACAISWAVNGNQSIYTSQKSTKQI